MFIHTFKINRKFFFGLLLLIALFTSILCFSSLAKSDDSEEKDIIKWVDFNVSCEALQATSKLDILSHQNHEEITYNWIELLAYLACKNGNNFKHFKQSDLDALTDALKSGKTMEELTQNMKYYDYYYRSFSAVLRGFIGNYQIETPSKNGSSIWETQYGLKTFLPIAKNYHLSLIHI